MINWFDIDDIFQRISVLFYLVCLFGYTTNVYYMFEEEGSTYKSAVAFYIAQRLFLGVWYLMVAWLVPMIRGTMVANAMLIILSVVFWIGSMHIHWPGQLALIFIAIVIDLFGGVVLITIMRRASKDNSIGRWLKKVRYWWRHCCMREANSGSSTSNSSQLSTSSTALSATMHS